MRGELFEAHLKSSFWAICPSYASAVLESIDTGALEAKAAPFSGDISSPMAYEKISNVAVITVRGSMDTRLAAMNAMCGGVANYEAINQMIDKAESDESVDTILYRVDSNGGNLAGVEVTADKVANSKKRTVALYENQGYSAAIWAFGGAKERYAASKLTGLGSIGVLTGYKREDDGKIELIRSSNAPNKVCDPKNKNCRTRIQESIDEAEGEFISRVAGYTGWSAQDVISNFKEGGSISAAKALELGFIRGIADYDTMLASLITKERNIMGEQAQGSIEATAHGFDFAKYGAVLEENAKLKAALDAMEGIVLMAKNLPDDDFKASMAFAKKGDTAGAMNAIVSAKASGGSTGNREMVTQEQKEKPKIDLDRLAEQYNAITTTRNSI